MRVKINSKELEFDADISVLGAIESSGEAFFTSGTETILNKVHNPSCPLLGIAEINNEIMPVASLKNKPLRDSMVISTMSENIEKELGRRVKLLNENHECYFISRWQDLIAADGANAGFIDYEKWKGEKQSGKKAGSVSVLHDSGKCIKCKACLEACRDVQGVEAITYDEIKGIVVDENKCVKCGQCIHRCPMGATEKYKAVTEFFGCSNCAYARPQGAMHENDNVDAVLKMLSDPDNYCVAQFAPAVRASLGEEFGFSEGELVTGKIYAALRKLGFKKVWDTNFAADLTIMEEGTEFIKRVTENGTLPMFTSCSPGWVNFIETIYPQLMPNLSTAKSPQQMFGAVAKTYGAKVSEVDASKMRVISIMPCTAKKFEAARPEMNSASRFSGAEASYQDVDLVLTTREFSRLIKMSGINIQNMPEESSDSILGAYTGAAPIFGRTGGVMEAALRTVVSVLTKKDAETLEFDQLGTKDGVKKAKLNVAGMDVYVAVAHGLKNARKVCESIISGGEFSKYHFIEVMTCPGGCIGGGGQPIPTNMNTKKSRTQGLNTDDREISQLRMSHHNPEVKALYENFLTAPLSETSHKLLHTKYTKQEF